MKPSKSEKGKQDSYGRCKDTQGLYGPQHSSHMRSERAEIQQIVSEWAKKGGEMKPLNREKGKQDSAHTSHGYCKPDTQGSHDPRHSIPIRSEQATQQSGSSLTRHQRCSNDQYYDEGSDRCYARNDQYQIQVKQQLHRSIQASTQMLYDVFDYSIGMIEELEKHEQHDKKVQNSGIFNHLFPVDYKKPMEEVMPGIELELKCLEAQMKSLPEEVTSNAKKVLVIETLKWAATREAAQVPCGYVDQYCRNVLEILLFQAPIGLPKREPTPMIKLTSEEVNQAIWQMAKERHKGEMQDEEFHKDDKKKAQLSRKRQNDSIHDGARRLRVLEDAAFTKVLEALLHDAPDMMDTT